MKQKKTSGCIKNFKENYVDIKKGQELTINWAL